MKRSFTTTALYFTVAVLAVSAIAPTAVVLAQTAQAPQSAGQALEIAPPVLNLKANPGETIQAKISLRDIASTSLYVTNEINDFTANGEDGTPKVILDQTEKNPYSIIDWINPIPDATLKSKQIQNVPVTINVPADAAPGGYYGVVRFTASAPETDQNGVSLSASIGALIFIRVNGDAKEEMSIVEFYVGKDGHRGGFFDSIPLQFTERIQNSGNVHEQPVGQILITDMFNKPAVNVNVNLEGKNVLPGSIRKFEQPLDSSAVGDRILFGPYTATLTMKYGDGKTVTEKLTFWIIPWKLILLIVGAIIILIIVGRIMIKRYNARLLSRHGGRRSYRR